MIPHQLTGLNEEGLRDYASNLAKQISVKMIWDDISKSELGKFIIVQYQQELDYWRKAYGQIDSSSPYAVNLLSFIQGIELCLTKALARLETSGELVKQEQGEIDAIKELLSLRQKQQYGHTLLPTGYKNKKEK